MKAVWQVKRGRMKEQKIESRFSCESHLFKMAIKGKNLAGSFPRAVKIFVMLGRRVGKVPGDGIFSKVFENLPPALVSSFEGVSTAFRPRELPNLHIENLTHVWYYLAHPKPIKLQSSRHTPCAVHRQKSELPLTCDTR